MVKITRRQLRKLINEIRIKPSIPNVPSDDALGKVDDLARQEEFQPSADSIAHAFKYPEDRSYSADLKGYDNLKAEMGRYEIEKYLPGFLNLPEDVIEVVTEFVFLSEDHPVLHIQLDEDMVEHELGEDAYYRGTHFAEIQKPENAEIVAMMNDFRVNPKAHDPKFYYIYAAHGSYNGSDPFARIDPHGMGDSQTGFHDGFREEYQKVTTKPAHRISSLAVEEAIIRMMRGLRPDHEEEVIN